MLLYNANGNANINVTPKCKNQKSANRESPWKSILTPHDNDYNNDAKDDDKKSTATNPNSNNFIISQNLWPCRKGYNTEQCMNITGKRIITFQTAS